MHRNQLGRADFPQTVALNSCIWVRACRIYDFIGILRYANVSLTKTVQTLLTIVLDIATTTFENAAKSYHRLGLPKPTS